MPEISVTFKAHGGHDAPWVVVKGDSVEQVSAVLTELREQDAFAAVKTIAAEFQAAQADAVAVIQAAIPGSTEVVSDAPAPEVPASPPRQGLTCKTCGAPASRKSGTSKKGPWAGNFCSSGDRDHTEWLKP